MKRTLKTILLLGLPFLAGLNACTIKKVDLGIEGNLRKIEGVSKIDRKTLELEDRNGVRYRMHDFDYDGKQSDGLICNEDRGIDRDGFFDNLRVRRPNTDPTSPKKFEYDYYRSEELSKQSRKQLNDLFFSYMCSD